MLVLHAGMAEGELLLWGETPTEGPLAPTKQRGRKLKTSAAQPLPYGATAEQLASALKDFAGSPAKVHEPRMVTAWLPTVQGKPIPSSLLIAETSENGAPAALMPWTVTALPLTANQAVDLLCASVGKETLAPGLVV